MTAGELVYANAGIAMRRQQSLYFEPDVFAARLDSVVVSAAIWERPGARPARDALRHRCADGAIGVLALIGARPVNAPTPGVAAQASRSQGRDAADAA
jgi:hypothetical protein